MFAPTIISQTFVHILLTKLSLEARVTEALCLSPFRLTGAMLPAGVVVLVAGVGPLAPLQLGTVVSPVAPALA